MISHHNIKQAWTKGTINICGKTDNISDPKKKVVENNASSIAADTGISNHSTQITNFQASRKTSRNKVTFMMWKLWMIQHHRIMSWQRAILMS
jgi:hypothetical protein